MEPILNDERTSEDSNSSEGSEEMPMGDILGREGGESSSDDDDLPQPVDLGRPRLMVQGGTAVSAEALEQKAEPAPFTMYSQFQVVSLLDVNERQRRPLSLPGFREAMQEPRVLQHALRAIGNPAASELLDGCAVEDREVIGRRLAQVVAEGLLEPTPQANHALRTVLDHALLPELWQLLEGPSPLEPARAAHFKALVERLLRRFRERTLEWMLAPTTISGEAADANLKAESIRTMPVFRLLRHLESEHMTALLALALDREVDTEHDNVMGGGRGRGRMMTGVPGPEKGKLMRWSNKFDIDRVLMHKMRVSAEEPNGEELASNAGLLLTEVLRHSNTHVDLLKNVMSGTATLFDLALKQTGTLNEAQFLAAWSVLLDLCRCLGRIWLPNRHTRIISDTIAVFVDNLPRAAALLVSQSRQRLGPVRMAIAEMTAVCLSSRLVSLFATPFGSSGLVRELLQSCFQFPDATLFHQVVFSGALLPMINNCVPLLMTPDDVFSPAASVVTALIQQQLQLWDFIARYHFSYDPASEPLRNCFAFNGFLTQLANALVSSSIPLPESCATFVNQGLDWTNTVENSPLTAQVYGIRHGGVKVEKPLSPASSPPDFDDHTPEDDDEEGDDDDENESNSDDDSSSASEEGDLNKVPLSRTKASSRLEALHPPPLIKYHTPPRPRLSLDPETDREKAKQLHVDETEFVDSNYWAVPIDDSFLI